MQIQAKLAEGAKAGVGSPHEELISAACKDYAPRFLPGFEVLYVDLGDGDRVSEASKEKLLKAGLKIELAESMPDALLWNKETDALWVIEAVCSDGEVDLHKVAKPHKSNGRMWIISPGSLTAKPSADINWLSNAAWAPPASPVSKPWTSLTGTGPRK